MPSQITYDITSVKVMRSYDYCHFEVVLGKSGTLSTDDVDAMRKDAARLADKAVAQYKISKRAAEQHDATITRLIYYAEQAEKIPEAERTEEQKAAIKSLSDYNFRHREYDYEDDWREDDDNNDGDEN